MKLSLPVFCVFLLVVSAEDVIELTDKTFEDGVKGKEIMLVEFFAPWCGHCKRLAPEYETAAGKLLKHDPPIPLAKVDCTEAGKESCSKHGVSGYPTLKIWKDGKYHSDYDGPRDADGIVSYMKKNSGPASKEYDSLDGLKKRIDNSEDVLIVGMFATKDGDLHKRFMKAADNKRKDFEFAHTFSAEALEHYKQKDAVVLFRPAHMNVKFEENQVALADADASVYNMEKFFDEKQFGLVGQLRPNNENKFDKPLVVAYYEVDWKRNKKGTNYWRNRVARVAKKFLDKVNFAIANKADFQRSLDDWKFDSSGDDVLVAAKAKNGDTFLMKDTKFSVSNLEAFVQEFLDGKIKPYIKSEPVPEKNDGPVKVVVGETFKEIVNDPTKDVLIEFYAPWCGHCKSLEPKYNELGEKLKDVKDVVIAKMDATANDPPSNYKVTGFPTIYWAPMGNKENPKKYQGGRDVDDFVKFIQQEATNPIEIPAKKKGKKKKKEEL